MKDEKGYTLVEIIAVLAILGTLLGIAGISANAWLNRSRVEGQTKQLYADLISARVSAMQKNRIFFVTLGANQYSVYDDTYSSVALTTTPDGDGNLEQGAGQDRLVTQKTAQFTLVPSPAITGFNFTQNGLASLATTTVDIWCQSTANPATDCIELSLTRILMGKWNGTTCVVQ
jgi:prepilin-type N-terminal cleavage/methylation domain-containing protein